MNDFDYSGLLDSFVLSALCDALDSIDETGALRKHAEIMYVHKMPVNEIFPCLMEIAKSVAQAKKAVNRDGFRGEGLLGPGTENLDV